MGPGSTFDTFCICLRKSSFHVDLLGLGSMVPILQVRRRVQRLEEFAQLYILNSVRKLELKLNPKPMIHAF